MLGGTISSTLVNRALEKPNKIRGEWLHLVNPEVENVSFFGLGFTSCTVFDRKVHPCGQLPLTC